MAHFFPESPAHQRVRGYASRICRWQDIALQHKTLDSISRASGTLCKSLTLQVAIRRHDVAAIPCHHRPSSLCGKHADHEIAVGRRSGSPPAHHCRQWIARNGSTLVTDNKRTVLLGHPGGRFPISENLATRWRHHRFFHKCSETLVRCKSDLKSNIRVC